jgi:putative endonuclease
MDRDCRFSVYIMQSASRRALYIGMTRNLAKRVGQHKNHICEGFTDDYNPTRLVVLGKVSRTCAMRSIREKQLKGGRREKKLLLIARMNPRWRDLAATW